MSAFWSLRVRLLAAVVLVAVVAVALVGVLARGSTTRIFELYVSEGRRQRAERLAPQFAAFYAGSGSWQGVGEWMAGLDTTPAGGSAQGRGRGQGVGLGGDRLILADAAGRVQADSEGELVGQALSPQELDLGAPVVVDGQQVGVLLISAEGSAHGALEQQFLQRVYRSLLWAGLAAVALAVVLGLGLAWQLSAPLRALTRAAQRLAQGPGRELPEVQVRGRDEIGELGRSFNQMARELARQESLRRNLMADIAHELRTPLSVIRGDLEAMLDGVSEPTPEALASLQEETLMLSRLVDDLRALAQAEAGELRLERRPTDLGELLRGVVASFDLQAQSQGQTLALELRPDLPKVYADELRIRQVAANLVSNALRHAAAAGGQVTVSAAQRQAEVQVTVADNGPGIPPEELPSIFERFWRGSGARQEGSGLGLAIARGLVQAHGGRIWAESSPGQGTRFHFTLPAVQEPDRGA